MKSGATEVRSARASVVHPEGGISRARFPAAKKCWVCSTALVQTRQTCSSTAKSLTSSLVEMITYIFFYCQILLVQCISFRVPLFPHSVRSGCLIPLSARWKSQASRVHDNRKSTETTVRNSVYPEQCVRKSDPTLRGAAHKLFPFLELSEMFETLNC